MKKIIGVLGIILGVLTLTACQEQDQAFISYVDADGNEKEVVVSVTDDKEIVQSVFEYAATTQYEDLTKLSIQNTLKMNATFSEVVSESLKLESETVSASLDTKWNMDQQVGLNFYTSGEFKMDENHSAMGNLSVIYNGALEDLGTQGAYLYTYAYGKLNSTTEMDLFEKRFAIDSSEIFDVPNEEDIDLEEVFQFIFGQFPSIGEGDWAELGNLEEILQNSFMDQNFSIEDFYKTFPNSRVEITAIQGNRIQVGLFVSYKDVLSYLDVTGTSIPKYINLENTVDFTISIDALTARLSEFSFEFHDVSLVNFILMSTINPDYALLEDFEPNLIQKFSITSKLVMEYEDVKVKILSAAEKDTYPKESLNS